MKNLSLTIVITLSLFIVSCSSTKNVTTETTPTKLNNAIDSISYSIGVSNGFGMNESLKTLPGAEGKANIDALIEGFVSAIKGDTAKLVMNDESARNFIQTYIMEVQTKQSEAEKLKGEEFLSINKSKEGVITTESGLQYKIVKQGEGEKPKAEDQVKVHYTGKLLDGTVFDSSVERGEPVTFGVSQVIRGWVEALQLMPVGSKFNVWIPSELGYGAQGAGQMIKPNSVLEFDIELLEIVK